jgi:O-methyltransferase involved in polyketide biosynthesis
MPRQTRNGWPMIARTKLIDDLVRTVIAEGADCVLNLAAGLDTRPLSTRASHVATMG